MNKLHRTVHHHLKLQHHKHTGRVLHHRHTSYRGLAVVFVLAGVFMLGLSAMQHSAADTPFSVSAVVPVPIPKASAVISLPQADSTLTSADNLVAGNCPIASPQVAIVLLVDGAQAGSALCDDNNNFAMPMRFSPGKHTLVAQSYTITNGKAPDSTPVQITSNATPAAAGSTSLSLAGTNPFSVLDSNLATAWDGTITGGKAPYNLIVDWGDGKSDRYTITLASQHLTHTYPSMQSYNARIAVSDASGLSTQLQYATVAYTTPAPAPATNATPLFTPTVAGLYGLFVTVVSVTGIVWLEAKHTLRHELALGKI